MPQALNNLSELNCLGAERLPVAPVGGQCAKGIDKYDQLAAVQNELVERELSAVRNFLG